jgi:predicted nucleic acid-binding protein
VPERWVVNASPVILLAKAGIIHFLPSLCEELVIPAGVVAEVQNGSLADLGRRWLADHGDQFLRPIIQPHPVLSDWHGGAGEAEVISWALRNPGFVAVLDDHRARMFAQGNGVSVIGSLRIIVLAKERGFIAKAAPALEKLRGAGAYVSDALINHAIALAGELPLK